MKKRVFFIVFLLISSFAFAETIRDGEPKSLYVKALDEQVALQEKRAASYLMKMQYNAQAGRLFAEANTMLAVKKSLINSFKKSKSIENPAVRWMLLEVLKKDRITEKDLEALQKQANKANSTPAR